MAEALGDEAFLRLGSLLEGDEEILRSGTLLYLGLGLRLRIGWVRFRVRARVGTIAGIKRRVYRYEFVQIMARDRDRVNDGTR